jgi:hypothetical protein
MQSVIHVFFIVTYETERMRRDNEALKRFRMQGYKGM